MACGFSYWDKMSILQITFWKIEVFQSNSRTHSSSLFGLHFVPLLPLLYAAVYVDTVRFPQQHFVKIQLCKKKKGKPLKQFFVREVPFSQLWKVLPEYGEQFSMRGVPIRLECTARTCWICLFRIYSVTLNCYWILTKHFIYHKCCFEIHNDNSKKN